MSQNPSASTQGFVPSLDLIERKLRQVASEYPAGMMAEQIDDIPRLAFNMALSLPANRPLHQAVICDIGGGIGAFSVGCAAVGFGKVILVDDFADQTNRDTGDAVLNLHRRHGVEIISRDVVRHGLQDLTTPLDVVTCFDSMEHWHQSPKTLFHDLVARLNPGGRFILSAPNCVNLRKRLTTPLGCSKWTSMSDWYEPAVFRGHVREPDVEDLRYIAADLKLENVRVLGRNWQRYQASPMKRALTHLIAPALRLRPSLCADIYLVGEKPAR